MKATLKRVIIFNGIRFVKGIIDETHPHIAELFKPHWFLEALQKTGDVVLHGALPADENRDLDSVKPKKEKPGRKSKRDLPVVEDVSERDTDVLGKDG
jgi:hypothetical protein